MTGCMIYTPLKLYEGDGIKEREMERACSTHGRKRYAGFWWEEDLEEGESLEGLCVDARIILNGG